MYRSKRILAFIGARGGSKGLKNKNILGLAGKPLIAWTIQAALKSRYLDGVIVSTDNQRIASVARSHGADVPFLRPQDLAGDDAPIEGAIRHAIDWLKENRGEIYDFLVLLQPTSPLRGTAVIDHAIEHYFRKRKSGTDTLVSVVEAPRKMGWLLKSSGAGYVDFCFSSVRKNLNRQSLPELYLPNGAFYMAPVKVLKNRNFYNGRSIPYLMEEEKSIDIDSRHDFLKAGQYLTGTRARKGKS